MDVIARIDAAVGAAFDNLLTSLLGPPVLPAGARPADAAVVQRRRQAWKSKAAVRLRRAFILGFFVGIVWGASRMYLVDSPNKLGKLFVLAAGLSALVFVTIRCPPGNHEAILNVLRGWVCFFLPLFYMITVLPELFYQGLAWRVRGMVACSYTPDSSLRKKEFKKIRARQPLRK